MSASAGGAVDALVESEPPRVDGQGRGADHEHHGREIEHRPSAPAERRQDREAERERDQTRPREREHQAGPEDRERGHCGDLDPRARVVEQHGGHQDHHQREVATEDVLVVEDRVDREVLVQLILAHELRADQEVLRRLLVEADQREDDRQPGRDHEAAHQQLAVPLQVAQQRQQDRERDVEEHLVLEALRKARVRRIQRLQGIEDDEGAEQLLEQQRLGPWLPRLTHGSRLGANGLQCRYEPGERGRRDHEIQRHQQVVGGAAGGLNRDSERNRQRGQRRQQPRNPVQPIRGGGQHGQREHRADSRHGWVPVDEVQLRGVPDVVEQQHRREHQRAEHRPCAPAIGSREHRGRGQRGGRYHTDARPGPGEDSNRQHEREASWLIPWPSTPSPDGSSSAAPSRRTSPRSGAIRESACDSPPRRSSRRPPGW